MGTRREDTASSGSALSDSPRTAAAGAVALRRFPFPYRSMLAICSDLDETPDWRVYRDCSSFLNTHDTTAMGQGVGLEVGNTIYFDMPPDQFAYWNTDDRGRDIVRELIRSGHVDCLHSFGDHAHTRAHAARALDELERHGCRLKVWIDHATAPTNFGSDIMQGSGDVPSSPAYHADLTMAHGVRYVWRGRVTSMVGQGRAPSIGGLWTASHPVASGLTTARELAKVVLARRGNRKYAPHAENAVTWPVVLRDGRPAIEFLRSNPHFEGPSGGDTAVGIPEVLNDRLITRLVERAGFCILYTHLGKIAASGEPFNQRTRSAFQRLADRSARGDVLVTTTRRLLDYVEMTRALAYSVHREGDVTTIRVRGGSEVTAGATPPACLHGLTFYVPGDGRLRLLVDDVDASGWVVRNEPDETGRASVSIPWRRLEFPRTV